MRTLRLASLICLLEAAALVVLAVVEIAALSTSRLAVGLTSTIFFLVYAAGLVLAARGLVAARSWARAPLVLTQLIALGVAWSFVGDGTTWVAVVLALAATVVLVILMLPSTTTALYGAESSDRSADGAKP